jgi:hypothetical protein
MGRFSIIEADSEPDAFAEASGVGTFPARAAHPAYGDFARLYYPTVFGDALSECSFVVADTNGPFLLVQCSTRDEVLSHHGFPIRFAYRDGLGEADVRKSTSAAFHHIEKIAADEAHISGGPADGTLSPVDRGCLDRGGQPRLGMRAEADLSRGEDDLRRDVRDSYRSLINWGRRNLRMVYVNAENPDRGLFRDIEEFHARIAGRVVHGEATWRTLFDHIAAGGGEVSLGYTEDGALVSGTMVVDDAAVALYFLAVYDREHFDKPMGHWPLFDSMLRAKARGRRFFDLGEFFARGTTDPKEYNIGFFKKGFTARHVTETVWTVPLGDNS